MNLFKYFKFYYKLTQGKIIMVMILAFSSAFCQSMALSAIATVSEYGNSAEKKNPVARIVYSVIDYFALTNENYIFAMLLTFVAVSFAGVSIFLIFTNIYVVSLQNAIYKKIQQQSLEKLMNAEYEYYSANSIGYFHNVVIRQLRTVAGSFRAFSSIFIQAFAVVPFLLVSFAMNYKLALILGVILSPLVFPLLWINKKTKAYSIQNVKITTSLTSIIIQILHHYKYLKATEGHATVLERIKQVVNDLNNVAKRMVILSSLSNNAILPLAITLICGLVYWQVAIEGVSMVNAGLVLGLLYMASTRLNVVPVTYHKFVAAAGSILIFEKLSEDLEEFHEHKTQADAKKADFSKSLVFDNVTFKYKEGERNALKNVSLTIPSCSSVAFVGGSGAGKSTIVNMIAGLLKPSSGKMVLSDTDYNELALSTLRAGLGYVTQESVIFADTVQNNISLWNPECEFSQIQEVSKIAHAHDFIKDLPDAYDSMLGDNGVNISGGQRQRISIAREFLRETPLLILDEATSSLDSESEQIIQQSIDEYKGKKTMVIIAHRLSTIKHCDKIYVLDEGKIVESGSYDALIAENGLFKKMVERQSL